MATKQKIKLLLLFHLPPPILALFQDDFDVVMPSGESKATYEYCLKNAAGKDAIICIHYIPIDKAVLDAAGSSLKVVSTPSAGYEHIDIEECRKRGVRVGYLGPVVSEAMAEFTIGFMIATARRFNTGIKDVENGDWEKVVSPVDYMLGFEIRNSTVGIVGFGNIGQSLAKRLSVFQTKQILYSGPHEKSEAQQLGAEYVPFEQLLQNSDFVVACCASNEQTKEMFNARTFNLMKPTSIFINIARGNLVNQNDLYEALVNKRIWAAGLDTVTPEPLPSNHPLIKLENCFILPHIGTASTHLRTEMMMMTMKNALTGARNEPMPYQLV